MGASIDRQGAQQRQGRRDRTLHVSSAISIGRVTSSRSFGDADPSGEIATAESRACPEGPVKQGTPSSRSKFKQRIRLRWRRKFGQLAKVCKGRATRSSPWLTEVGFPPASAAYYRRHPLGDLLEDGQAVMVNAVAYRSPHLSREPANLALAELLPSLVVHRAWCMEELLPAARRGARLVVVHRNGLWKVPKSEAGGDVIFSTNPVSPHLPKSAIASVRGWLALRSPEL
jgi:hypothetical protein